MLPLDFPRWAVVFQQTQRWIAAGCFEAMVHELRAMLRWSVGRADQPTAVIIDSATRQSTPESGHRAGYDGHKRRTGTKLHAAVDTLGELLALQVTGGYWERPTQTGDLGVDVPVETSGSIPALHHAIRATCFGGTICMISFDCRDATGLALSDEFHVNRLQLVSVRAKTLPVRDPPVWDLQRLVDLALSWLASGRVRTDGIVTPIVPFADSGETYHAIDERPAESIKLEIRS
jgi:hypothetical protein